ncbi:hypothetical protein IG631_09545 [Alternaria alternata]|nr:hypothetical protein IG631_09545 [Alternaria alternata]
MRPSVVCSWVELQSKHKYCRLFLRWAILKASSFEKTAKNGLGAEVLSWTMEVERQCSGEHVMSMSSQAATLYRCLKPCSTPVDRSDSSGDEESGSRESGRPDAEYE